MKSKLLKILIAVFAVCLVAPAFSAVENVKVGGDISIYGVLRGDFDIDKNNEDIHFYQTTARVYVSADLSENVSTMIRVITEKFWGFVYIDALGFDLAYIQVKDLLAPGLNLTVGRQEIQLGEGLVIGSRYNAYDYPLFYLPAYDLGLHKAFDAIKVDYTAPAIPLSLTAFLSKIDEEIYDDEGEVSLYGIDIGYKIADIADLDVYYVRRTTDKDLPGITKSDTLDTAGIRVISKIPAVENFNLKGEYAKQFGEDSSDVDYDGSALLLGAEYKFSANMEPKLKVNYLILSGDDTGADNEGWEMVYPSNIGLRIGPLFYAYDAWNSSVSGNPVIGAETNLKVLNVGVSLKPVEKLSISIDGYLIKLDEKNADGYDDVGTEINLGIEYKYTEDLTFGLSLGKILADDVIEKTAGGDDAWQAVASMKVAF